MTAIPVALRRNGGATRTLVSAGVFAGLAGLALLVTIRLPSPSLTYTVTAVAIAAVAGWMFLSENYAATLGVFVLYLGMLDGFLKLKTGLDYATLGRDVLLYAIVAGALARFTLRRKHIVLPPLSGWILAFSLVVLVSIFNPGSYPVLSHALPSVRPHLEFVPLFIFGFLVMRSPARLRAFLVLLLVCAAANGVVNLIQFNLEPDQLAAWGPGYSKFVNGEGALAGRVFSTDDGDRVRPFGLAGDAGGGGVIAALAIPGAIALIALGWRRPRYAIAAALLGCGALAGVVASQGRGVVVGAVVMVLAYAALVVTPRRLLPTMAALAIGAVGAFFVVDAVSGTSDQSSLSRYESIAPTKVFATTSNDRGGALTIVPKYIADYPLGHGLGTGGPATGFGGGEQSGLSAESEFAFLVVEVGVLGLIIVTAFTIRLLHLALSRIRQIHDPELRPLLSAVAAPLFGIAALYVTGPATSGSPLAPYLWFVAGVLSYWLIATFNPPARRLGRTG